MILRTSIASALALLLATPTVALAGFPDNSLCDLNGDSRLSIVDAQIALTTAVGACRSSRSCGVDGDHSMEASDALLLLRHAVGLAVTLNCGCIYADECFYYPEDCIEGYPPGYFCGPDYLCVACEDNSDCEAGEVCNRCTYECEAAD